MTESFNENTGTSMDPARLATGAEVLREMLARSREGVVSTQSVRKELEARNIPEALELIARLKIYDHVASGDGQPRWHHLGRSFLTEERYRDAQRNQEEGAKQAEAADEAAADGPLADEIPDEEADVTAPRERKKRRREEARLGAYIVPVLEELYDDEASPESYVFDVHAARGGNDFENVDLLAIHWRSAKVIDIVTVEVKLKFTAFLVQQARNYTRFSERVWIALPVDATTSRDAAMELRAQDQLLFEHVVEAGLGILACHRGRGGAYDVFPIHWPRRNVVDAREREELVKRYRPQFEESGVIPPVARSYPKL
ncbi:MAG: hypothetical protein M3020_15140 [Myxococcota bacterium]|jgi:hypothetical protein|nr:hypothetical protein [Myxococcota bacterium]